MGNHPEQQHCGPLAGLPGRVGFTREARHFLNSREREGAFDRMPFELARESGVAGLRMTDATHIKSTGSPLTFPNKPGLVVGLGAPWASAISRLKLSPTPGTANPDVPDRWTQPRLHWRAPTTVKDLKMVPVLLADRGGDTEPGVQIPKQRRAYRYYPDWASFGGD